MRPYDSAQLRRIQTASDDLLARLGAARSHPDQLTLAECRDLTARIAALNTCLRRLIPKLP